MASPARCLPRTTSPTALKAPLGRRRRRRAPGRGCIAIGQGVAYPAPTATMLIPGIAAHPHGAAPAVGSLNEPA